MGWCLQAPRSSEHTYSFKQHMIFTKPPTASSALQASELAQSGIRTDIGRPEQICVTDITCVPAHWRCVYLSLVADAYSRNIIGYHVHTSLQTQEVAQVLLMALRSR